MEEPDSTADGRDFEQFLEATFACFVSGEPAGAAQDEGSWSSEQSCDRAQLSEDEVEDDGFSHLVCEPLNSFPGRDKAAVVRRSLVPRHKPTRQFLRSSLPAVLSEEPSHDNIDDSDDETSAKKFDAPQTEHDHLAQAHSDESKLELPLKSRDHSHVETAPPARAMHPGKIPGGLGLVAAGAAAAAAAAASRTTSSPGSHQQARATAAMDTGAEVDTTRITTVGSRKQFMEKEEEVSRPPLIPGKALGFKLPPIVPRKPAAAGKPQPDAAAAAAVAAGAGHEVSTTGASTAAAVASDASAVADSSARVPLHRDQPPAPPAKPPRPPPPMSASVEAQQSPVASPKVPPRSRPMPKGPAVAHAAAAAAAELTGGGDSQVSEDKKLATNADPAAKVVHTEQFPTVPAAHRESAEDRSAARIRGPHADDHFEVVQHQRQRSDMRIEAGGDDEGERLPRHPLPSDTCHDADAAAAISSSPARRQQLAQHPEPATDSGMLAFARSALRSSASRAHPPRAAADTADTSHGSTTGIKRAATVAAADSGDPAFSGVTLKTMKLDAEHAEARLEAGDSGTSSSTAAAAAAAASTASHSGSPLAADCTSGVAVSESAKMVDAEDQQPKSTATVAAVTDSAEGTANAVRRHDASGSSSGSGSSIEPAPRVPAKPQPRPCPPQKPALKALPQQQQLPAAASTKHDGATGGVKPAAGAPPLIAAATAVGSAAASAAAGSRPPAGATGNARRPGAPSTQPGDILPAAGHRVFAGAKVSPSASDCTPASVSGAGGHAEIAHVAPQSLVDHESPRAGSTKSDSSNGSDDGNGRAGVPATQQTQQPAPLVRLRRKSPPPQPLTREGPDGRAAADSPLSPGRPVSVQRRHTHAAYDVATKSAGASVAEPIWVQLAAERARRNSVLSESEPAQKTPPPSLEHKSVPASSLQAATVSTAGAAAGSGSRPLASLAVSRAAPERQSAAASSTAPACVPPSKAALPVVSPRAGHSTAHDLAVTSKDLPAVIAQRRPSRELAASVGQQNDENKPPSSAAAAGQGSPRGGSLSKNPDGHLIISNMSPSGSQPLGERRHSVDSPAAATATCGKQQPSPHQVSATAATASAGVELSAEEQVDVKLRLGRTSRGHPDKHHLSTAVAGGALPAAGDAPPKSQVAHNGAADRIGFASKDKADAGTPMQEPEFMKRVRERKARLRESGIPVGDDE